MLSYDRDIWQQVAIVEFGDQDSTSTTVVNSVVISGFVSVNVHNLREENF